MSGSAFTQRNVVAIALVCFFFFVYVLSGGKISTKAPASLATRPTPKERAAVVPGEPQEDEVAEEEVDLEEEVADVDQDVTPESTRARDFLFRKGAEQEDLEPPREPARTATKRRALPADDVEPEPDLLDVPEADDDEPSAGGDRISELEQRLNKIRPSR